MYLTRNGNLRKRGDSRGGSNMYVYVESCGYCGKPFLATKKLLKGKTVIDECCCHSCVRSKDKSKGGVCRLGIPLYDTYAPQFPETFEKTKPIMVGKIKALGVRCHNSDCRKWFVPKLFEVKNRKRSFCVGDNGWNNFYCTNKCKDGCPVYGKQKYREGEGPGASEPPYTSQEYQLYRKVVLERENYVCEYCGKKAAEVHHEKSQKTDPIFALDPDYGHACCKECHYKYGHKKGTECSTGNLAKKIC